MSEIEHKEIKYSNSGYIEHVSSLSNSGYVNIKIDNRSEIKASDYIQPEKKIIDPYEFRAKYSKVKIEDIKDSYIDIKIRKEEPSEFSKFISKLLKKLLYKDEIK